MTLDEVLEKFIGDRAEIIALHEQKRQEMLSLQDRIASLASDISALEKAQAILNAEAKLADEPKEPAASANIMQRIKAALEPTPHHWTDIAERAAVAPPQVSGPLSKLKAQGKAINPHIGMWAAAS